MMNRGLMTTENTCINILIAGVTTTTATITNTGDIVSTLSNAITSAEAGLTVQNSGTISGRSTAISLGSTDQTAVSRITNSGLIEVQGTASSDTAILSNGTIRLLNTGTIFGLLNLGDGNDTIDNRAGTIIGQVLMDDGSNLFLGGALGEFVTAGVGNDTLRGEGGDDDIASGAGDDALRGGAGDDVLSGSIGLDTLRGGDGDDTLTGGGDADTLHGGAGEDVFRFLLASDSDTAQVADVIQDFRRGDDVIDLAAFAPAAFTFVGTGAFTGGGSASFGFDKVAGNVIVQADLNGDGVADFELDLLGAKSVSLSDFVL